MNAIYGTTRVARITVGRQDAKRVEHVRNADGRLLCCTCVLQMSLVSYTQPMSVAVGPEAYRSPTLSSEERGKELYVGREVQDVCSESH